MRIADQWPRAQRLLDFIISWTINVQIAAALFYTEQLRVYQGFRRATITCSIYQTRPHHRYHIGINPDTNVSRGIIQDIALQLQPDRIFAVSQENERREAAILFHLRIFRVGYSKDNQVPTVIYAELIIGYTHQGRAPLELNLVNSWTNSNIPRSWNRLPGAHEGIRQEIMMNHYDQQLPRMERRPDPSAPNDSDQALFFGRGWSLNRPIRLNPIYDQSEHQGRSRHINEWTHTSCSNPKTPLCRQSLCRQSTFFAELCSQEHTN